MKSILKNNWTLLKYIFRFAPEVVVWKFITVILSVAVDATLNVMFLQNVVDAISMGYGFRSILYYIFLVSIVMFFHDLLTAIYSQYIEPVGKQKIHKGMHRMIFEKIMKIDLEKFDDADFYNDYIWALKEVDNRTMRAFVIMANFIKAVIESIVFILISIQFDWHLLFFVIVPVIIRLLMGIYKSNLNYKINLELNPVNRKKDYSRRVFYLKEYAKELRSYSIGEVILDNFDSSVDKNISIVEKYRNHFVAAVNLETNTYWFLGKMPITIYMCYKILYHGTMTTGSFVAMYSAGSKLMYSLASIFNIIPALQENGLFAEKIIKILQYENRIEAREGKTISEPFEELRLENVNFRYPFGNKLVLNDVNIEIRKGEKIAVVGLNGAGKTTLIKLLMRFYDPTTGEIKYNGQPVKNINTSSYRSRFVSVFQDYQIYAVSVLENLYMKKEVISEDEIANAKEILNKLGLDEFSEKLNETLTKEFDKAGIVCSGGQKQKISVARALLHSSELIVMDEASSALDPISEDKIQQLVINSDKSVILISHRLSAVKDVDRIYFMEDGRVVEFGSHDELMEKGEKYAQMYNIQAEKYSISQKCVKANEM